MFVSEELDKKLRSSSGVEKVLNFLDNMPWTYSHVGTELRLDTTRSPFLKPNADVSCCHGLEGYLHLVDGFLASNCPFRNSMSSCLHKVYVFIAQVVFHISSISSLVFQINYEVTFKNIYFFHFTTS
ncbi:phospholipase [Lithospermum erythrorhizon]|uniref:Phospholipase n=1 Tax=Lithospermum erythrorhizon TaxID=34254 RepID=A0AAV3RYX8_LITER